MSISLQKLLMSDYIRLDKLKVHNKWTDVYYTHA